MNDEKPGGAKDHSEPLVNFEHQIEAIVAKALMEFSGRGLSEQEAADLASEGLAEGMAEAAPKLVAELLATMPEMLKHHKRAKASIARQIRSLWGEALDQMYAAAVAMEEVGSSFDRRRSTESPAFDARFEVLTGIYARSCRTVFEIHHLLSGGYAMAALARCRTLHELAVIATVIDDHGAPDGAHSDLADRYLAHVAVANHRDLKTYQANCAKLGMQPISPEEESEIEGQAIAAIDRYGAAFRSDYGWAIDLTHSPRPTFRDLETIAELSHWRGYYQWASHEVHAGAKGWALNTYEVGKTPYRLTGSTVLGLAEPGHMAVLSQHRALVALVSTDEISIGDAFSCLSLQLFVQRVGESLDAASQAADQALEDEGYWTQAPES